VEKQIDSERCILCFSCAAVCPHGSVQYGLRIRPAGAPKPAGRRIFLKQAGAIVCGAVYLAAPGLRRLLFARSLPAGTYPAGLILPPGAESPDHYFSRCIACHACVAACPVGVLKPVRAPQPALDYTHAGCQFTCTECGKVCPAGAIHHLSADEKQRTRIALSALVFERCVVNIKRESCGACAEVCPTGALTMISYTESGIAYLTRPVFDERYCIGCGVCLSACPAEPRALAITAAEKQSLTAGARPAEELGDELHIADTETFPF
jgi:formate hydrogenlyase subunit 6/NADH:ubiquinone oxidoreductase subunit I